METQQITQSSRNTICGVSTDEYLLSMNATERAPYFEAGDVALVPLGFKRRKKDYEWRRAFGSDIEWIHINFGLGVINPSYGVRYTDLDRLLPAELGIRCGPSGMLAVLTGKSYSSSITDPSEVAEDLLKAAAELPKLGDRDAFMDLLMSEARSQTLLILYSDRIRTLPLMLANSGRLPEAFEWLEKFKSLPLVKDRRVPGYDVFVAHFRAKYLAE